MRHVAAASALVLVLVSAGAAQDDGPGAPQGTPEIWTGPTTRLGTCAKIQLGTGLSGTKPGERCVLTGTGGGGGGAAPLIGVSSCGPIDGSITVYIGEGTCADPTEGLSQVPVKEATTLTNLACRFNASVGSQTVTIRARTGVCGAGFSDSAFVCTITAGNSGCDSGSATLVLGAGTCHTFRVESTGVLPAPRHLHCTVERTA